jgi:cytochrome c oxidase subunit II
VNEARTYQGVSCATGGLPARADRRSGRALAASCQWHISHLTLATLVLIGVSGCKGNHAAFDSAGPQAGRIESLWWLFFWVSVVVYVASMAFVLMAIWRHRRSIGGESPMTPTVKPEPAGERRLTVAVAAGVGLTVVILFVLLFADIFTGRAIHTFAGGEPAVWIKVTGHQWWWEVQYQDSTPSNQFITANEIHIPVGKPVRIELHSADVIHSFWVPNLHGKKDMIPGHPTSIALQADRPGVFIGQCAEFCGFQHAKMRLVIVAEPEGQYAKWLDAQRQPAVEPSTPAQVRGREVFLNSTCLMCHAISGTHAGSRVGPDLTHLASRGTIAAGSVPNQRDRVKGWILDPHKEKPGVRMTQNVIEEKDLDALVEYLLSLK